MMYAPKFNSVLVEIDDQDAKWGSGNDESMLGKSYHKGKVIMVADYFYPKDNSNMTDMELVLRFTNLLVGQGIIWNEGAEAGTTFEENGKLYGFIYWYDIRGVKE